MVRFKGGLAIKRREGRASFLKKRSKKLLQIGFGLSGGARSRIQKFFGSFSLLSGSLTRIDQELTDT
jgi:hypothetical protein